MSKNKQIHYSKLLSYILRHRPDEFGLSLDEAGWVDVDLLLEQLRTNNKPLDKEELLEIIMQNDKQRFELNEAKTHIRARQGHSTNVDLGYSPSTPPEILFLGTPQQFISPIRQQGLKKMQRHHVHLHEDIKTAQAVGSRRGKPVLLIINALHMHQKGHKFFVTQNHVWLTDHVPPEYIQFPENL